MKWLYLLNDLAVGLAVMGVGVAVLAWVGETRYQNPFLGLVVAPMVGVGVLGIVREHMRQRKKEQD